MNVLEQITRQAIDPALALLPKQMDSQEARVALLAIGLQESEFTYRWQIVDRHHPEDKGPARSFWMFEKGTALGRGGVWGVTLHPASRFWLSELCRARDVPFHAYDIWQRIETDDVLAAGLARLLLFTDARKLPDVMDEAGCWEMYAKRLWRPGKPHPEVWPGNHKQAREFVLAGDL